MNTSFLPKAYLRGSLIDFDKATVSIATHALHYGTAAFAGMRVEPDPGNGGHVRLFRPGLHAARMSASARLLGYDLPAAAIIDILSETVAANPGAAPYYLRSLAYVSDLAVEPRLHNVEYDLLVYGLDMGDYLNPGGVRCWISSWVRGQDRSLPLRGKIAGSYVTSALAKTEAGNRGNLAESNEAILLNAAGKVAEASGMNIFLVRDGVLITPDVTQDILEGITRRSVIELARHEGLRVVERAVDRSELLLADELFLTGTAARIAPVISVEQFALPESRPVTEHMTELLRAATCGSHPAYGDWSVVIASAGPEAHPV